MVASLLTGLLLAILPLQSITLNGLLTTVAIIAIPCRIFGTHRVIKWPVYALLCALIAIDLLVYVVIRVLIYWLTHRAIERKLNQMSTYAEWRAAAIKADADEGRDVWQRREVSEEYDWRHVKATTERLRHAREKCDYMSLMSMLQLCLKNNAYGEMELSLYTRTRVGTKVLLEEYRDEVCRSLRALAQYQPPSGSAIAHARREFGMAARASFGGCALVLSGGATFGIFHFGVVKALVELKLLPPVVCGASAGAVVAAVTCTRDEKELARILDDQSDLYREMGWGGPLHGSNWWKFCELMTKGRIYDLADFKRHMEWFALGLTFKEAYEKTGRILTISATPLRTRGRRAVPLQLNYISTPHVDIASAVLASSCVPGLIDPVELLEKGPDGKLRPYHLPGEDGERIKMRDGSFESDVPLEALAATFGATFTVVSQVNPHVAPFYAHLQGRAGRPSGGRDSTGAWRGGFLLGAIEVALKEDMRSHLRTLKRLQLGRALFGVDWSNLWLQPQDGSVVLTPSLTIFDYFTALHNVTSAEKLAERISQMERSTWEASSLIRMRMDVQRALDECCDELGAPPLVRVPSSIELRPPVPYSQQNGGGNGKRAKMSPARSRRG